MRSADTLHIVVHGASGAGKTMTARAMGETLGADVLSPQEANGQTMLFDWLEYSGGNRGGHPIKTRLITVPGHLPERSRLLVQSADVVVFVIDTTPQGVTDAAVAWSQLETWGIRGNDRVGLVVQANKRDHPDALPLEDVRALVGLDGSEDLVESSALLGEGVRQTFVYAVRAGLNRSRGHPDLDGTDLDGTDLGPQALEARLIELDRDLLQPGTNPSARAKKGLFARMFRRAALEGTAQDQSGSESV